MIGSLYLFLISFCCPDAKNISNNTNTNTTTTTNNDHLVEDGNVRKEKAHVICTQSKGLALETITKILLIRALWVLERARFGQLLADELA